MIVVKWSFPCNLSFKEGRWGDGATYLYSTTGWREPLRDDIGFL